MGLWWVGVMYTWMDAIHWLKKDSPTLPSFLTASSSITSEGRSDDPTYSLRDLLDCPQSNPFLEL